jgi:type IV secretory pathway VirB4 component
MAEPLNGKARLHLLHNIFHMDGREKFLFEWDWLPFSGLSTKDYIAPSSFEFRKSRSFRMGHRHCALSFLQIMAPELNDRMLADFLAMESSQVVNLHIQSIDQTAAIKTIKRKITDLDKMKIEEQKKAVRSGYDMDIIPSDLATYGGEAKKLLQDLQSQNERMFLITFLIMNTAESKQHLENNVFQTQGIAQRYNCSIVQLDFQQEQGLNSSLPLGMNQIEIQRGLTTSSTAIFVPFTTQELFQNSGEPLYYGLNALSNNLIMVDRKALKNPNGLILGTPGSGKSFAAKREIANAFLITRDDITICDPEGEYYPLVERLKGQVIKISPTSGHFINPMDINLNYSEDESPLSLKSDFILSLCELIVGGRDSLQPIEKTVIDRSVRFVYQGYLNDPRPENVPILGDLHRALLEQPEKEARHIATALEIYVSGSLNVFNHQTNVDIQNRLVCFDIKELGKQLKKLGMLIVQDQVWGRVTANRAEGRSTRYYIDEFHLLLKEEQTAAYSVEIWKRFRKWGGIPTGITQNVKDLLSSREIENILENSDFIYMLNQAGGDRQILAKQLNISPHQLSYVTNSGEGEGLLFYGNVILPFSDRFPKGTELYQIMTTKPGEVKGG